MATYYTLAYIKIACILYLQILKNLTGGLTDMQIIECAKKNNVGKSHFLKKFSPLNLILI